MARGSENGRWRAGRATSRASAQPTAGNLVFRVAVCWFIAALTLSLSARAQSPDREAEKFWLGNPVDVSGHSIAVSARWIVIIFLGQECPLSNASIPRLNQLAAEFRGEGVAFLGAYVDPTVSLQELQDHQRRFAISFPMIDDRAHKLVRLAGATYTPEVAVFSGAGQKLYQGRIDDRVGENGAARPAAVHEELRDSLLAVIHGKSPPVATRPGYGCAIPTLPR